MSFLFLQSFERQIHYFIIDICTFSGSINVLLHIRLCVILCKINLSVKVFQSSYYDKIPTYGYILPFPLQKTKGKKKPIAWFLFFVFNIISAPSYNTTLVYVGRYSFEGKAFFCRQQYVAWFFQLL